MIPDIDYSAGSLDAWSTFFKTAGPFGATISPITQALPKLKPAGMAIMHPNMTPNMMHAQNFGTAPGRPAAMAAAAQAPAPQMPSGNANPTMTHGTADQTKASVIPQSLQPQVPANTQVGVPAAISNMQTQLKPQGAAAAAQAASNGAPTTVGQAPMNIPATPTPTPAAPAAPAKQGLMDSLKQHIGGMLSPTPGAPAAPAAGAPAAPAPAAPAAPVAPAPAGAAPGAPQAPGDAQPPQSFWQGMKAQAPGAVTNMALMAGIPMLMNHFQSNDQQQQ